MEHTTFVKSTNITNTKMIKWSSNFVEQQTQIQGTQDKRDDNTGRAHKPKNEFRRYCKSLYPTCDLQQIFTEEQCYPLKMRQCNNSTFLTFQR